jgi:hypothetical protein
MWIFIRKVITFPYLFHHLPNMQPSTCMRVPAPADRLQQPGKWRYTQEMVRIIVGVAAGGTSHAHFAPTTETIYRNSRLRPPKNGVANPITRPGLCTREIANCIWCRTGRRRLAAVIVGTRIFFFLNQYIHCGNLDSTDWLAGWRHHIGNSITLMGALSPCRVCRFGCENYDKSEEILIDDYPELSVRSTE